MNPQQKLTQTLHELNLQMEGFDVSMQRTKGHKPDVSTAQSMVENQRAIFQQMVLRQKRLMFAVERANKGLYGVCCICDEPIPAKRLQAIPDTCVCIQCIQ